MLGTVRTGVIVTLLLSAFGCTSEGPRARRELTLTSPGPRPPNIVLVLMDDFSMDLLQTMRSADADGAQRCVVPARLRGRLALLCLPCQHLHRPVPAPAPGPHQHRQPAEPGGCARWVGRRSATTGTSGGASTSDLHRAGYVTGFVGKYLNEYVPTYDGRPAVQPRGWTEFTAILRSAYDGWDFEYTAIDVRRARPAAHPAPPPWATDAEKDRAYADQFASRRALGFMRRHRTVRALLPGGGDVRAARPDRSASAGTG